MRKRDWVRKTVTIILPVIFLISMAGIAIANWKFNPFTGKMDYYENGVSGGFATGGFATDTTVRVRLARYSTSETSARQSLTATIQDATPFPVLIGTMQNISTIKNTNILVISHSFSNGVYFGPQQSWPYLLTNQYLLSQFPLFRIVRFHVPYTRTYKGYSTTFTLRSSAGSGKKLDIWNASVNAADYTHKSFGNSTSYGNMITPANPDAILMMLGRHTWQDSETSQIDGFKSLWDMLKASFPNAERCTATEIPHSHLTDMLEAKCVATAAKENNTGFKDIRQAFLSSGRPMTDYYYDIEYGHPNALGAQFITDQMASLFSTKTKVAGYEPFVITKDFGLYTSGQNKTNKALESYTTAQNTRNAGYANAAAFNMYTSKKLYTAGIWRLGSTSVATSTDVKPALDTALWDTGPKFGLQSSINRTTGEAVVRKTGYYLVRLYSGWDVNAAGTYRATALFNNSSEAYRQPDLPHAVEQVAYLASDVATSTTLADVAGLSYPVTSGHTYKFHFDTDNTNSAGQGTSIRLYGVTASFARWRSYLYNTASGAFVSMATHSVLTDTVSSGAYNSVISGDGIFTASSTGTLAIQCAVVNGGTETVLSGSYFTLKDLTGVFSPRNNVLYVYTLNAGDRLSLRVKQDSGSTINATYSSLSFIYLGP